MLGNEQGVSVALRKLLAGVEGDAQGGAMGLQFQHWRLIFLWSGLIAELRVRHIGGMPERIAEMQAGAGGQVDLLGGDVVAQHVPAIVGEPEVAGFRVPVEADAVANALGVDFRCAAVRVHAQDGGEPRILRKADVAGRPHRHIQLSVGAELDVLPAVVPVVRQAVRDQFVGSVRGQPPADAGKAQHPVQGGNIQVAVAHRQAAGHGQPLGQHDHLRRPAA